MRSFVRLSALALAAATASVPAKAADLPWAAPADSFAPAPVYTWTGFYAGVHAGYAWGDVDGYETVFGNLLYYGTPEVLDTWLLSEENDFDGFIAGGQVGYNLQVDQVVFGIEADGSWAGLRDSARFVYTTPIPGDGHGDISVETDWFATLRGRIGYAFDRFLVYGTGGLALAGMDARLEGEYEEGVDRYPFSAHEDGVLVGWTAGAGVEAMITPNITGRLEYLFADLGDVDLEAPSGTSADYEASAQLDVSAHIFRGALNYKFDF